MDHAKLPKLGKSSQIRCKVSGRLGSFELLVESHLSVLLKVQRGGAFSVAYGACEFPTCTPCKGQKNWMKNYRTDNKSGQS